jgi:putative transposase
MRKSKFSDEQIIRALRRLEDGTPAGELCRKLGVSQASLYRWKRKSRIVSLRIDEDDFARLDTLAKQTSCSRGEVLRRFLRGARLESTVDAQALNQVSRLHANLNRIGGLLKLAIREGVSDPSTYRRLNLELIDSAMDVRRAVNRLAGHR